MTQTAVEKGLYDRDLNLWLEATLAKLQTQQFEAVDWEHVIEELEAVAKRDKRELRSRLQVLLSHLLKRQYVNAVEDFRGWESTIREQRSAIAQILADSPSLKAYGLEQLESTWQKALSETQEDYPTVEFPQTCPFPADIDTLLTQKFWQA